jgi:hypothetical protein
MCKGSRQRFLEVLFTRTVQQSDASTLCCCVYKNELQRPIGTGWHRPVFAAASLFKHRQVSV